MNNDKREKTGLGSFIGSVISGFMIVTLLSIFLTMIAATSLTRIKITMGENRPAKYKFLKTEEIRIPCKLPLEIEIPKMGGGCNSNEPQVVKFLVEGVAVTDGKTYVRFEEIRYEAILGGKVPKINKLK